MNKKPCKKHSIISRERTYSFLKNIPEKLGSSSLCALHTKLVDPFSSEFVCVTHLILSVLYKVSIVTVTSPSLFLVTRHMSPPEPPRPLSPEQEPPVGPGYGHPPSPPGHHHHSQAHTLPHGSVTRPVHVGCHDCYYHCFGSEVPKFQTMELNMEI